MRTPPPPQTHHRGLPPTLTRTTPNDQKIKNKNFCNLIAIYHKKITSKYLLGAYGAPKARPD